MANCCQQQYCTHTLTPNSCWCLLSFWGGQSQPAVTESVWSTATTSFSSPPLAPATGTLSVLGYSPPPSSLTWRPLLAGDVGRLAYMQVRVWAQGKTSWPSPMNSSLEGSTGLFVHVPGKPNAWDLLPKGEKDPLWSVIAECFMTWHGWGKACERYNWDGVWSSCVTLWCIWGCCQGGLLPPWALLWVVPVRSGELSMGNSLFPPQPPNILHIFLPFLAPTYSRQVKAHSVRTFPCLSSGSLKTWKLQHGWRTGSQ